MTRLPRLSWLAALGATLSLSAGCGDDSETASSGTPGGTGGGTPGGVTPAEVVEAYAGNVHVNYEAAVDRVVALRAAVDAFVAAPSAAGLEDARQAWIDARPAYMITEAYRFYGGPIDDDDGPEARINGWPLDEAFIDAVAGDETAGIVNALETFPELTKELIAEQNELGGEKNISAGFHAIEFLLWGQDTSETGPGDRPHTDFLGGDEASRPNGDRRGRYLALTAELLEDDLRSVEEAWEPGEDGNYAAAFLAADPQASLGSMLLGMGSLAGGELAPERMQNALLEQDQEEEHSCFSDTTLADHANDVVAIANVYRGWYGFDEQGGPGLTDLVRARDADLDDAMRADLAAAQAAVEAIPEPFDQAILTSAGQDAIEDAIAKVNAVATRTVEVATLLGIELELQ